MPSSSSSYVFNLYFAGGGFAYFSVFTRWKRFVEHNREIRMPDLADTQSYIDALAVLDCSGRVIHDKSDFDRWLLRHGWAFVPQEFVRENMPQWLRSRTCISSVQYGFIDIEVASPTALSRTPASCRRRAVLERESHCCLLCGTADPPITMHHVRAYSLGGETTTRNLVALCEPCNQAQGTAFNTNLTDQPLGDISMVGPSPREGWYQKLVYLSSDLMFTRCEIH